MDRDKDAKGERAKGLTVELSRVNLNAAGIDVGAQPLRSGVRRAL